MEVTASLQTDGCDEALDLGCLGIRLGIRLLRALHLSPDHVLPHIILLAQVEEPANLGRTLGTETLGEDVVGEACDIGVTLLDDDEREDSDVGADDASTHRLALALTGTTGAVAGVAVCEEELDTIGEEDTLLHGETLLVVATSDAEDVALPFVANGVTRNFLGDFLFVEYTATRIGY